EALVSGGFSIEQAQLLAKQLNAGALPVPVEIIEQETIGATLGQISVEKSITAGLIGLALVIIFMILNYGRLGILASIALAIYGLVTLAVYEIIPVTLTLSGIAGFILSIGMAVDSNILIFERMKEELSAGRQLKQAMELGFGRAWDSIRDANVATLVTVFILFNPFNWNFLVTSGMVRGFALTLGIGIVISLFTGIIVTRTLVRVFYRTGDIKTKN
ncbi:SecD/SecF family protein translocase subunit, partial [candidate division WWE3 bacterium]|nr:SecD/SecF family protein translocase subunit [candidate division WWE3 bacterium]